MPTGGTDQDLVAAANRGDESAMEALYERYASWVMSRAAQVCGSRDDAADVLQETFAYVFGKFPGFELRAQLKTYLYPIVRSAAVTRGRKRQREGRALTALAHESAAAPDPPAEADDRRNALAAAVETLPAGQRDVLLLRFADGLELQEIAEAVGIPLGTVKSRLHHALQALRENDLTKSYFE